MKQAKEHNLTNMKLIVDIVHNPELREQMRSGDVIVKINGGSANKYL